ncbi:MAG TPA: hypothetical protein VF593_05140 [Chthoniobacteraceae bacterium]|jgi:hypothetical protein
MRTLLLIAILASLFPEKSSAQADKPRGFEAFRMVRTRNIFDPNRQPMRNESPQPIRVNSSPNRGRSNYLALTGTMVTPGKSLAFFSGGGSDSGKVVSVGDVVADYKITAIAPGTVELNKGGAVSSLAVGNQLTLGGNMAAPAGAVESAPPGPAATTTTTTTTAAAPATAPTSTASGPSNNDDVLRRLMERRQKEFSK